MLRGPMAAARAVRAAALGLRKVSASRSLSTVTAAECTGRLVTSGGGHGGNWRSSANGWYTAFALGCPAAVAVALAGGDVANADSSPRINESMLRPLPSGSSRESYENRIRAFSEPEKLFGLFAIDIPGKSGKYLQPHAFLRAVTADLVDVMTSEEYRLFEKMYPKAARFFKLMDENKDGLISYSEFLFYLTLLTVPPSKFEVAFKMFDMDGNGTVDAEEFKHVMSSLEAQTSIGGQPGRRESMKHNDAVYRYLFGDIKKNGGGSITLPRFEDFLRQLHDSLMALEFFYYDTTNSGTITARDFGLALTTTIDHRSRPLYVDRVRDLITSEEGPEPLGLAYKPITFAEYKAFFHVLENLTDFQVAIGLAKGHDGTFNQEAFARAARAVSGVTLSETIVETIFFVLDKNKDGKLNDFEFFQVLKSRNDRGLRRRRGLDALTGGVTKCVHNFAYCIRNGSPWDARTGEFTAE